MVVRRGCNLPSKVKFPVSKLVALKQAKAKARGKPISYDTAMEEVVADGMETILKDGKVLEFMEDVKKKDHAAWEKIKEWFQNLAAFLREMVSAYSGQSAQTVEGAKVAEFSSQLLNQIEQIWAEGAVAAGESYQAAKENVTDAKAEKNTTQEGGGKTLYEVRETFVSELYEWFENTTHEERKVSGKRFLVGTTSETLKSVGVKDYPIYLGGSKVDKILEGNESMSLGTIADAVMLLDSPILVMKSLTVKDSIVLFGEVLTSGRKPVMISLLLSPKTKSGEILDYAVITSAYGRTKNNLQNMINKAKIYYINEQKNRTDKWLKALGLQLPSAITKYGPIDTIEYSEPVVNSESAEAMDVELDTKTESVAPAVLKSERTWMASDYVQARDEAAKENVADAKAEKNTTQDGGVKFMSREETTRIKAQIMAVSDQLNQMDVVASITTNGFVGMQKSSIAKAVEAEYAKFGKRVDRQHFGIILLEFNQINKALEYLNTDGEKAALLAVPRVLKRGIVADQHTEHKARAVDSITFAAPVEINGRRGNVGVVVQRVSGTNRFKTLRILLPNGKAFEFVQNKEADSTTGSSSKRNGLEGIPIESASKNSIRNEGKIVNRESAEAMDVELDTKTESVAPAVLKSERTWTASDYVQARDEAAKENVTDAKAEKNTTEDGGVDGDYDIKLSPREEDAFKPYAQKINSVVNQSISGKGYVGGKAEVKDIMPAGPRIAAMVAASSGNAIDISNRNIALSTSDIWHEFKRHTSVDKETSRGQIAFTKRQFQNAVKCIISPDMVETIFADANNPTQRQSFAYAKKTVRGHYVVVEAVGGKKNPQIYPVMIVQFSKSKWNKMMAEGKSLGEILHESEPGKLQAQDVEKNKKSRVTAAQFASYEAIANTLRSPQLDTKISQPDQIVNSESAEAMDVELDTKTESVAPAVLKSERTNYSDRDFFADGVKSNYTVSEISEMFDAWNSEPELEDLAKKVFAKLEEIISKQKDEQGKNPLSSPNPYSIAFVRKESFVRPYLDIPHGSFVPAYGIYYNIDHFMEFSDQEKAHVLLHEAIHACTYIAIASAEWKIPQFSSDFDVTPDDSWSEEQKAGLTLIQTFNQVRTINNVLDRVYGQKSVYEMVAEMSNPEFRAMLKKHRLWDRIVDAIKRIFGITQRTAYDAVSYGLEKILELDMSEVRYSERNWTESDYEQERDETTKEYKNGYKDAKFSDRDYSYDALVNKPDMAVTNVDGNVPRNRADVVYWAKQNAAKVGKVNPKDGSVSVRVDDIGADVLLGTKGLEHGLRRLSTSQTDPTWRITLKAGEIIKNAIRINEVTPSKEEASGAYVLIGTANNKAGDFYIVRFVVNQYSHELASMDVLYAINAKKEDRLRSMRPGFQGPVTDPKISIADLLDIVNQHFPDILPEDVLKHYGYDARPEGDLGQDALEPVTYDDKGNVIPLPERFNIDSEDIRYSTRDPKWKPKLDNTEWGIVNYIVDNNQGTAITSTCNMFFKKSKGRTLFGIYSTDDSTLLYVSRERTAEKEHAFADRLREEHTNGNVTDTSAEALRTWGKTFWMRFAADHDNGDGIMASGRFEQNDGVHGRPSGLYASPALRNVLQNIFKEKTAGGDGDGRVKNSERSDDSVSNRALLANAFEDLAKNEIERNKIQEYKGKIDLVNAEERKLRDLNVQIKELSFAKGPRDTAKIRQLRDEATKTANRISICDKKYSNWKTLPAPLYIADRECF